LWHSLGVSRLRRACNESHNKKNKCLDALCYVISLPKATCVRDRKDAIVVGGVICCSAGGLGWGLVLE